MKICILYNKYLFQPMRTSSFYLCNCVGYGFFWQLPVCVHRRRIRLIEGNAKSLRPNSNLKKNFAAAVYLPYAPSPPRFFVFGWSSKFVGSESGQILSIEVLQNMVFKILDSFFQNVLN
jgi:hypothetical protein